MTNREALEAIVIRNFLNAEGLSQDLNVDLEMVESWMEHRSAIPDAAIRLLVQLNALLSQAGENVVKIVQLESSVETPVHKNPVVVYLMESEFQLYCEDAKRFSSTSIHRRFVMRVVKELIHLGFNSCRVPFDQHHYLSWLQSTEYQNSSASRGSLGRGQLFGN